MHKKILKLKSGLRLTKFEFFNRMVTWLDHHFTGVGHKANIQRILSKMFRILESRGQTEAIRYVKTTRLKLLQVLERYTVERICSKDGNAIKLPRELRFLRKAQTSDFYPLTRLVLSVLAIFRTLKGNGVPSFASIQQGSSKAGNPTELVPDITPFLRSLGLNPIHMGRRSKKLNFKKFKMTVKMGPKGHALWTSYLDLLTLPESLYRAIGEVGGPRLQEDMSNYLVFIPYIGEYLKKHLGKTRMTFRRLSVIRDKEGKNREIAILDYYSQQALRPLHQYLFRLLKKIPQDSTFDHSKSIDTLVPSKGSQFHSIDLSNATDRFPIEIQRLIIETMFGKEYSENWKTIMVGFPFDYQENSISYARGNPMGAYSSWSAFALAHHFLVYSACKSAGIPWKQCPYMLLGDDIVIADDKVAVEYIGILQRFDIPFSQEKSHQSPYLFEFAKRFVHCGTEISPFPLGALYENRNNWLLAIGTIIEEAHRKRWNPRVDIYQCSIGYMKAIGYSSRFISKRAENIQVTISLRLAFAGLESMARAIKHAAFLRNGLNFAEELDCLTDEFIESKVLLSAFSTIFKESVGKLTDAKNGKPLGLIAEDLTIIATSLFGIIDDPFLLIRSCPILQVYGEVEETYLRLLHDYIDREAVKARDYKHLFMAISIPTGDESFYMRRKDVLQLATSKLAGEILSMMDEAREYPQVIYPYGI